MKVKIILLLAGISLLFGFKTNPGNNPGKYEYFLNDYIDTTVRPGDDFFKFAMGKWLKNNPIPESESSWGIWSLVNEENYKRLRDINEEAMAQTHAAKGSAEQKIGDFWYTGMDSAGIEAQGIKPLLPELQKIDAVQTKKEVLAEGAYLYSIGVNPFLGLFPAQDEMNSDKYVLHIYQGGIGLPDRDYYFDQDDRTVNIRNEYVTHITKMFILMGSPGAEAQRDAATVMHMETALAGASRKLEDLRDPYANYNKMDLADLQQLCPAVSWNDFFADAGAAGLDSVIVGQPEFLKALNNCLDSVPVSDWKVYLRWNLINTFADKLSSDFDRENFHFYGTVLSGTPEQRPRWKRVLDGEEDAMGFLLGQLYVQKYYPPEEKERYEKIVDNVIDAYRTRIQNLTWMSDSTKQKALVKLDHVTKKVGYPDKWRDYTSLDIERDSYVQNSIRANKYLVAYYISKLYKPVDRSEWDMTPQTWNAYYNPSNNEIVLPAAAFIVPGVPDQYVDDAIAYGYAAGSTIGHEITHGFDDQGRQFDENGNLVDWWTPEDEQQFLARTDRIVKQFDGYIIVDSIHVNGKATEGENIADLGGMLLGLDAFMKTDEYKEGKSIGGYTPVQRYFLGFALSWYGNIRPERLAMRAKTDVHSPNFLRVNGPVTNVPQWYTAFNVKPGDKMYVPDSLRVKIW